MTNYLELPTGEKTPEVVNVVIEIPGEGINKYEYDKKLHVFRLDRNLYSPVHYPGDYGFIPSTLSEDGDPLDVLVLVDAPSFPGCVMEVRPIGTCWTRACRTRRYWPWARTILGITTCGTSAKSIRTC
jgi:inorganic pyrophosphatase